MKMKHLFATILAASTIAFNANAKLGPMAGGSNHGVYIERGAVFAFGGNYTAAVGPNAAYQQFIPLYVNLDKAKGVYALWNWTIVQRSDNTVWFWGYVENKKQRVYEPVELPMFAGAEDLTLTRSRIIALIGGEVYVYDFIQPPYKIEGLRNVVSIDGHENHVLALTADGRVYAFGDNTYGQLGNGSVGNSSWTTATPVVDAEGNPLTGVSKIEAGQHFSVALIAGKVFTWGRNKQGTFGTGDFTTTHVPYAIQSLIDDVVDINANSLCILARKADGSLWGWGWHDYNNMPVYLRSYVPERLINYVDSIPYGKHDSYYVMINGKRAGWGSAVDGSLGTGNQTELTKIGWLLDPIGYDFSAAETTTASTSTTEQQTTVTSQPVTETVIVTVTSPQTTTISQPVVETQPTVTTVVTSSEVVTENTRSLISPEITSPVVYIVENSDGSVTLTDVPPVTVVSSPIVPTSPNTTPTITQKCNNGWGNGDQCAPGKSATRNNAENNTQGKTSPVTTKKK